MALPQQCLWFRLANSPAQSNGHCCTNARANGNADRDGGTNSGTYPRSNAAAHSGSAAANAHTGACTFAHGHSRTDVETHANTADYAKTGGGNACPLHKR